MSRLPEYIGPAAFGLRMGLVVPGGDVVGMIVDAVAGCDRDGLLEDGDVICITESVVARSQNNFVSTGRVAAEVRAKLGLGPGARLGVVWPITSRNRFSLILRGLAEAVGPGGEVVIQLPFPDDEVGNRIVPPEFVEALGRGAGDVIRREEFAGRGFVHPITGMDYPAFYEDIVRGAGAHPVVYLGNDPRQIGDWRPDGVLIANVHGRERTRALVAAVVPNCLGLGDLCNTNHTGEGWSEWGLMGSNMSAANRLKLAPREGELVAGAVQARVAERLGRHVEVLIYGDGAYKDPTSGIYELADPQPGFGSTAGFKGSGMREGLKYKYLADVLLAEGKEPAEIEALLAAGKRERHLARDNALNGGTTPRRLEDLVASLADLVSGSADAGTPVIVVKGFFSRL